MVDGDFLVPQGFPEKPSIPHTNRMEVVEPWPRFGVGCVDACPWSWGESGKGIQKENLEGHVPPLSSWSILQDLYPQNRIQSREKT